VRTAIARSFGTRPNQGRLHRSDCHRLRRAIPHRRAAGRTPGHPRFLPRAEPQEDLSAIQKVRAARRRPHPTDRMAKDEREFLQCVRAGISGYLLRDASAERFCKCAGRTRREPCAGALCAALFRYFESDTASLPCASGSPLGSQPPRTAAHSPDCAGPDQQGKSPINFSLSRTDGQESHCIA